MGKFMIATFLLLGWGFYELSGGAEFEPEAWPQEVAEVEPLVIAPATSAAVTRNETTPLSLNAEVTQISLEASTTVAEPAVAVTQEVVAAVADPASLAEPVAAPAAEAEPTPVAATLDLRAVAGTRVNMREGPGTTFGVIDTLSSGTEAEVIEVNADGWARIRLIGTNQIGWMAERLLNPI